MKVYYTPRDGFACTMDTFSQIDAEKLVSLSTIVLKRNTSVSMVVVCVIREFIIGKKCLDIGWFCS